MTGSATICRATDPKPVCTLVTVAYSNMSRWNKPNSYWPPNHELEAGSSWF